MKKQNGPWVIKSSREVYKNPWISVREDIVEKESGIKGLFGIVTKKDGVSILPIDTEGNVYLVEQFRYLMGKKTIEVICGGIDKGETPEVAAKRELAEETGIKAKNWKRVGKINPDTSVVNSTSYMFIARDLTFEEARPEGTEEIRLIKTSIDQAAKWVEEGKITHASSVTLILKARYNL